MDQVIIFDKSFQQRLQEYDEVLPRNVFLPVSQIQREWGFYLELTMDPAGWQAIWKVPRKTCEHFHIPFPSVVLVFVLSIDLKDLTALVKVLAVQDDIHISAKHCVPMAQLWPTKEQDKSVCLNLHTTSNVLDMLRFFYNHLFMPWDYDDSDSLDWKAEHLEQRLRLYYDMKNGVIPRVVSEHLQALITEAKRLQQKREQLEGELEDEGHTSDDDNSTLNMSTNSKVQMLMELHVRMMEIKGEVDILENPLLRSVSIKKLTEMSTSKQNDGKHKNIWLIYDEANADEYIAFLNAVKGTFPNETLKFAAHLNATLESANPKDVFILKEATHQIKSSGALELGGMISGIGDKDKTILTSKEEEIMFDFKEDNVLIENVTIEALNMQCAIVVRNANVTIKNSVLIGDRTSSTHQGIILLNGATLELIDCQIRNFYTAIVGNSGAQLIMKNTEIYDCDYGLKIYDNCVVSATKTIIRDCKEYGICVETENTLNEKDMRVGDFDTLNIIPKFQMESTKGANNEKGDAIINQKSKLAPIADLFSNPDLDPTICTEDDSGDEMEVDQTMTQQTADRLSPATV